MALRLVADRGEGRGGEGTAPLRLGKKGRNDRGVK